MDLITKKILEEGFAKRKAGISSKWGIRAHLTENPSFYTPDARQYLIEIARQVGFSDQEIASLLKDAETAREHKATPGYRLVNLVGVLALVIGIPILLILSEYPTYSELAEKGIESKCKVIDARVYESIRRGRRRQTELYTFICNQKHIRRADLPGAGIHIGDVIPVYYVPAGEGCLMGATADGPLSLLIYRLKNGACFRISGELETTYLKLEVQ